MQEFAADLEEVLSKESNGNTQTKRFQASGYKSNYKKELTRSEHVLDHIDEIPWAAPDKNRYPKHRGTNHYVEFLDSLLDTVEDIHDECD